MMLQAAESREENEMQKKAAAISLATTLLPPPKSFFEGREKSSKPTPVPMNATAAIALVYR